MEKLAMLDGQVHRVDGNCEVAKHAKERIRDVGRGRLLGNIVRCCAGRLFFFAICEVAGAGGGEKTGRFKWA